MHYKNRANVYKVLGRAVFGSCCCCPLLFVFGWGSHVGYSSVVALVFGFGMDSCQISVIFNHCIKARFFGGLYKLQSYLFSFSQVSPTRPTMHLAMIYGFCRSVNEVFALLDVTQC